MNIIATTSVSPFQKENIFRLWNACYPSTITYRTLQQLDDYLNALAAVRHYFLMATEATVAGWAITFTRENEKWFALIIGDAFQGKGAGSLMLDRLKTDEAILNGWAIADNDYTKADGSPYRSPLAFYLKNHFYPVENVRLNLPQMKAVKIRWQKKHNQQL